jgi:hypothetical protein
MQNLLVRRVLVHLPGRSRDEFKLTRSALIGT